MKKIILILICFTVYKLDVQSQIWSDGLAQTDSLLKVIEPINLYGETRFGKEFRGTNAFVRNDSLFIFSAGKQQSFIGRDIKLVYFFKPDPWIKWMGAVGGAVGAAGILYSIDYFYNTIGYKFGATEYALATSVGSVVGYMIGRGIGAEKIEILYLN